MNPALKLLPMFGHTKGNRSAATCHFKCGNACAAAVPNESGNEYFRDIASAALSRRALFGLGGAAAAAVVVSHVANPTPAGADFGGVGTGTGTLDFTAIKPVARTVDAVTVPEGYSWAAIIRWGDPLFANSAEFNPAAPTAEAQASQFGYNSDYLNIIADKDSTTTGVLVNNHEYTNEEIMFDPAWLAAHPDEARRVAIEAHGFSVVEIERSGAGKPWTYVRGGRRNRRITGTTPFTVDGPAAGDALLKTAADPTGRRVLGTLNNCAGGTTPWGTVVSGEENFNQYFKGTGSAQEKRYGIPTTPTERGWELTDPRFDLTADGHANEANRFGWIVEIDPQNPTSTPVKHTALGRFKHEGATIRIAADGRAVAYSGDDERFDYVYKFISTNKYVEGDRAANMKLLSDGDLYVARFTGNSAAEIDGTGKVPADGAFDGSGEWIPLVQGGASKVEGMSVAEVLVYTRLAADKVGATKMDRPEDVEPNPVTGKVYIACTNNTNRGKTGLPGADEANPRSLNKDGHVIEMTETENDAASLTFDWNILIVAGDPAVSSSTYFSGYPANKVSPISCPDNLAFDSVGNLWISTDGQPGTIGYCDALHKVTLTGENRGRVEQFLAVPAGAETCGPVIHDLDNSVFVAVQHPGEGGTWAEPTSYFPDYVKANARAAGFAGPRPSVVQVYRTEVDVTPTATASNAPTGTTTPTASATDAPSSPGATKPPTKPGLPSTGN